MRRLWVILLLLALLGFDRLELESVGAYLDPAWQPRPLSAVRAILAKECGYLAADG